MRKQAIEQSSDEELSTRGTSLFHGPDHVGYCTPSEGDATGADPRIGSQTDTNSF